ncbi:membrane protein insertase YidC [Neptunicella marina]|uniref:Membrane protein insertase YidC n=1 Tax=Neptunicella marina TaxID=2125989 RepID=A0A8J6M319_9ALTE|nr:membrane protein insertase YidC [Neptunicella marina]MBC3766642.1 membrane protein insertase YidC [Neptunicella marina]
MESQRSFMIIALLFVSYLLWQQWQMDYGPKPVVAPVENTQTQQTEVHDDVPQSQDVPASGMTHADLVAGTSTQSKTIHVTTDALDVVINTKGGDIVSANLTDFNVDLDSDEKFSLLRATPSNLYIAQSGLIGRDGPDASKNGRPDYQTQSDSYTLTGEKLDVPLVWQTDTGLTVTKTFTFYANQHKVDVNYTITNQTGEPVHIQQYAQLKQVVEGEKSGGMFMPTYRGSAYSTDETRYEKYTFDDIEESNLKKSTKGGWVAMLQHYFVSAWIPPKTEQNNLFTKSSANHTYATIGFTGEPKTVEAGQSTSLNTTLYIGPKDQDLLHNLADNLDLTVDYGIFFWISQPLFALLKFIQGIVGNWGVAIIVITIIVKGAMYPLTKAQYVSMGKMRALQPKMAALKERYGDDRQKMSMGMMELYKKEKVNPMGGCFPMLLQMPIFLALYYVFLESVEFRHAGFFLWIKDLSVQDPYYVLPVLMGISMFLLQKLNPATIQDPMQQKIFQWMPVMMTIFFLWFPAGLVLYWLVSNLITLTQAKIIYAGMEKNGLKTK